MLKRNGMNEASPRSISAPCRPTPVRGAPPPRQGTPPLSVDKDEEKAMDESEEDGLASARELPIVRDICTLEGQVHVRLFMAEMGEKLIPVSALPLEMLPSLSAYRLVLKSKLGLVQKAIDHMRITVEPAPAPFVPASANREMADGRRPLPLQIVDDATEPPIEIHTQPPRSINPANRQHPARRPRARKNNPTKSIESADSTESATPNESAEQAETPIEAKRRRLVSRIKTAREAETPGRDRSCILQ